MAKKRIIFYTDCYIFGGCEKPIFEIISSERFYKNYDYLLIYRISKAYQKGMSISFAIPSEKTKAVWFPDINTFSFYLDDSVKNAVLLKLYKKFLTGLFIILQPAILLYEFLYLAHLFSKEKGEFVHINNGGYPAALSCRVAAIAARLSGKKHILLNVHNMVYKNGSLFDRIIDSGVRKSVSFVITVSLASELSLITNRGFNKNKILNIYNGIKMIPSIKKVSGRYISMVGRLEERKGHKYAILAFKELISKHPEYQDIKLLFIGDGPLLPELKNCIYQEKLDDKVIFLGYRTDCIDYIASSLFLINPSLGGESLPYSIMEAMSVGIPVIGTDVAGIPEEIYDGITGILIPPGDIKALSEAMLILLTDNKKRLRQYRNKTKKISVNKH